MTQLDILVHIREGDADPLAARTAIAIARRVPAHLYGLGVAPLGAVAYTTPETVSFQAYEADRLFAEQAARRAWWREYLTARDAGGGRSVENPLQRTVHGRNEIRVQHGAIQDDMHIEDR